MGGSPRSTTSVVATPSASLTCPSVTVIDDQSRDRSRAGTRFARVSSALPPDARTADDHSLVGPEKFGERFSRWAARPSLASGPPKP
jgi:hypothetical protein